MKGKERASLEGAEILLIKGMEMAFALEYSPGQTPRLLAKGKRKEAERLIMKAQDKGIPVIENTALEDDVFSKLNIGDEIPEFFYRPVAHALALLYKTRPSPHFIRYVRFISRKKSPLKVVAENAVQEMAKFLEVKAVSVEVGSSLIEKENFIRESLSTLRQRITCDLGLVIPAIEVSLNPHLKPNGYVLKLKEVNSGEGEIETAIESAESILPLTNKLKQLIYSRAHELLGYCETEALLDNYSRVNPKLVKELFPAHFSIPALRLILRNLLKEQIPIRDMGSILDSILENLDKTSDPDLLTEYVRAAFSHYLCQKYKRDEGYINVLLLSPAVEEMILNSLKETAGVRWIALSPEDGLKILTAVGDQVEKVAVLGYYPIILANPSLRRFLRRLVENTFPHLAVLSYSEITPLTDIRSVGMITFPHGSSI